MRWIPWIRRWSRKQTRQRGQRLCFNYWRNHENYRKCEVTKQEVRAVSSRKSLTEVSKLCRLDGLTLRWWQCSVSVLDTIFSCMSRPEGCEGQPASVTRLHCQRTVDFHPSSALPAICLRTCICSWGGICRDRCRLTGWLAE